MTFQIETGIAGACEQPVAEPQFKLDPGYCAYDYGKCPGSLMLGSYRLSVGPFSIYARAMADGDVELPSDLKDEDLALEIRDAVREHALARVVDAFRRRSEFEHRRHVAINEHRRRGEIQ